MSDDRPRPTARPRPGPRPRVAGTRPGPRPRATTAAPDEVTARTRPDDLPAEDRDEPRRPDGGAAARRRSTPALVLGALCAVAAVALGLLLWQRPEREFVDPAVLDAARESVEALYAYDYRDSEGSVQGKLDVLTGDLRTQYETDLQSGIIDTYEQVSATTRYEVADVGLQQVDDDQTAATVVVFGQYVVESVTSGTQAPPQGSECTVTPEGAQSCTQTVQLQLVDVDGAWKVSGLTLLTTG